MLRKTEDRETVVGGTLNRRGEDSRSGTQRRSGRNGELTRGRRRSSRYSGDFSDDETHRRGKSYDRRDRRGDGRRYNRESRRTSGAYSDDEYQQDRRRRERGRREKESDYDSDRSAGHRRRRNKKRGPTNIDDFDNDDFSESDSYSSDSSYDSDYSGRRRRLRSSASVSEIANTAWALGADGEPIQNVGQRIKIQQTEIKRLLELLALIQKQMGMTTLPAPQQKMLQEDLQKLGKLQSKLKDKQGDRNLKMQLLGQQMLLCEHLKDAHTAITGHSPVTGITSTTTDRNLQLQFLQHQQQALAEQQRHILLERQMEAEQQRQMMLAAEQQRQMQLQAQLQATHLYAVQPQYGMAAVPQVYPYGASMGYY